MPESHSELRIALIGNPNTGKSSLFNALTGMRQRVGNYPGVTVEKKVGRWALDQNEEVQLIHLPGTYSLSARSLDERIAVGHLRLTIIEPDSAARIAKVSKWLTPSPK